MVARMAAKINFRIQITSFAAQTSAAEGSETRSIGDDGDSAARRAGGRQTPPDGPRHGDQLHPTDRSAEKSESGFVQSDRQCERVQCDCDGQPRQQKCGNGNREHRQRVPQARCFELGLDPIGAIRIALRVC
jgi:hypothetical protein